MITLTGNTEGGRPGEGTQAVCVWCCGVMGGVAPKARKRMCQPCFARMMREHISEHQPRASLRHASDR